MTNIPTREDIAAAVGDLEYRIGLFPPGWIETQWMIRVAAWLAAMPSAEAMRIARDATTYHAENADGAATAYGPGPRRDRALREAEELRAVAAWLPVREA